MSLESVYLVLLSLLPVLALGTAAHALLHSQDPRGAFGWVAVCLLFPLAGPVLYCLFGVNRIRTRARLLSLEHPPPRLLDPRRQAGLEAFAVDGATLLPPLDEIARVSSAIAPFPPVGGNRVEPLHDGEEAFPAMLAAISAARLSVYLTTYIFQTDATGRGFVEALAEARGRGVEVRVIIDGVGERYAWPGSAPRLLRRRGIQVARFLPPKLVPPQLYANLRVHRKLLVVDGEIAFTGGMNIADKFLATAPAPPARATDIHFRIEGPVVTQLEQVFLEDWAFCTGEELLPPPGPDFASRPGGPPGRAVCRAVADGPADELDRLATLLVSAISAARHTVTIVTPYFLPAAPMLSALQTAALRGVEVRVVLPAKNNMPFVHWASRHLIGELLLWGVQVCYQPAPFAHTKLFLVDGEYALVGSANLDPRSLRLNFELVVEIYDRDVARHLEAHVTGLRERSRAASTEELAARALPVRLRDAACWLFSPYL